MTNFQKLIVLFLFIITFSSIYYFFSFLPAKEKAEQKRIEQIKSECFQDTKLKTELLSALAKSEGVPISAPEAHLSPSQQDHVYKLCLRQHGL